MHHERELLKLLQELKSQVLLSAPRIESFGICGNIWREVLHFNSLDRQKVRRLVVELTEAWTRRSDGGLLWPQRPYDQDNFEYPVGGMSEFYLEAGEMTLWKNPIRIHLLDWMIKELEKSIQQESQYAPN